MNEGQVGPENSSLDAAREEIGFRLSRCPNAAPSIVQRIIKGVCREWGVELNEMMQHISLQLEGNNDLKRRESYERAIQAFAEPAEPAKPAT